MKPTRLRLVKSTEKRPVAVTGRQPNAAYRIREHLTEHEMDQLLAALKRKRHGQRDWLTGTKTKSALNLEVLSRSFAPI
jgi:hypothetical protein